MNTKTDLIAKLLATENLTVLQEPVHTASFDIKNRVLRLPQWKEMGNDLLDMLIGHEVGHALYTTDEFWKKDLSEQYPHIKGYFNVIEDVRIEKLMKRRYPGLRKSFNLGYRDLQQRDFFALAGKNFDNMLLIDKINLYFKAGFDCGVTFSKEEKQFITRAESTETIQDVIDLSIDIYNFSKEDLDKKMQSMDEDIQEAMQELEDEDQYEDDYEEEFDGEQDLDNDGDADEDEEESRPLSDAGIGNDDLESKTEKALRQKLSELADTNTKYEYVSIPNEFPVNPIVGYKTIIEKIKSIEKSNEYWDSELRTWLSTDAYELKQKQITKKFKDASKKTVNYLVKEFEMRKSAGLLKRAKIAKSGSLDSKKLYQYKLNDDIFKQVMSIPEGKNHGMVFLLDWSGSMNDVIQPTIEQVINLAMFCKNVQIPFQVFAFTDRYDEDDLYRNFRVANPKSVNHWDKFMNTYPAKAGEIDIQNSNLRLLELFSNKMTSAEFNFMIDETLKPEFRHIRAFRLGGTPLNHALSYVYTYIPKFKAANKVEKLVLITLTDGASAGISYYDSQLTTHPVKPITTAEKNRVVPFIQDKVTKKNYEVSDWGMNITKVLLKMIKDRYDITILGFYICKTNYHHLQSAYYDHYGENAPYVNVMETRSKMKKEGFVSFKDTGRDDLFIIPTSATKINDDTPLQPSKTDSAAKIAKQFSKFLNAKKDSRVLLNKFIGWVA